MHEDFWRSTMTGLLVVVAGCVILVFARWRSRMSPGWGFIREPSREACTDGGVAPPVRVDRRSRCCIASSHPRSVAQAGTMDAEFWPSTMTGLMVVVAGCVILVFARWRSRVSPGWAASSRSVLDAPREVALHESRRIGRRSVVIAGWCVVMSAGPAVVPVALPDSVWVGALVVGAGVAAVFLVHGAITFGQASVIDAVLRSYESSSSGDDG